MLASTSLSREGRSRLLEEISPARFATMLNTYKCGYNRRFGWFCRETAEKKTLDASFRKRSTLKKEINMIQRKRIKISIPAPIGPKFWNFRVKTIKNEAAAPPCANWLSLTNPRLKKKTQSTFRNKTRWNIEPIHINGVCAKRASSNSIAESLTVCGENKWRYILVTWTKLEQKLTHFFA